MQISLAVETATMAAFGVPAVLALKVLLNVTSMLNHSNIAPRLELIVHAGSWSRPRCIEWIVRPCDR